MSNGTSRTCRDVRLESGLPKQITVTVPKSAGPQYRSRYRGTQPALYLEYRSSERQPLCSKKCRSLNWRNGRAACVDDL
jgi:hypothetical protein